MLWQVDIRPYISPMTDPALPSFAPDSPSVKSVVIVEDDAAVRKALSGVIQRSEGLHLAGNFASGEEALLHVPALNPNILLVDINLPGIDGVECVRQLGATLPGTLIIMLTVHDDTDTIFEALSAGASGYLLKPVQAAELLAAIRDVYAGGSPMSSSIARKVVQSFKKTIKVADPELETLTTREREILDLLSQGLLYKEIGEQLGVAYRTVHTHIERIYRKLHVRSRAQAVAKYLKR
jgi:DNA-binding NarL/FixJ family response regulator